jgi:Spy/CpxP family protein refolding chaperone
MVLISVLILSGSMPAQPQRGERGARDEMQVQRMKEKVGLTDDQALKIKAILKRSREEAQAEFGNSDGDRDARRAAMMKRGEKNDAEIMKLLTKEQQKKYEELKKERRKEMEERRRDRQ